MVVRVESVHKILSGIRILQEPHQFNFISSFLYKSALNFAIFMSSFSDCSRLFPNPYSQIPAPFCIELWLSASTGNPGRGNVMKWKTTLGRAFVGSICCKSLAVWKKKGEKSEETKKQKKGKDFFAADKRGLTQIWSGRKKIKSLLVWENWRKGEWEKMENGWK